ncbi:MAG: C1 family peptidase [Muribaculaceae bacterium]|nr:C1 family peptidase [Muribaculaceae bacterium]
MEKKMLFVAAASAVALQGAAFGNFAGTGAAEEPAAVADTVAADTAFVFTDVVTLRTTPVKDQNKSGTCWCFAGTSMFEDEILRKGGQPLDLSEMFTVRQCYLDKADRYVRMYGGTNFSAGGSILDVPYVWKNYGALPESAYPGLNYGEEKHVHGELDAVLKAYLDAVIAKPNKRLSTSWRKGVEGILDAYLGEVPATFTVDGKEYTPRSYAESLGLVPDDYVALTSFTHHPFYAPMVLEVSDNWLWGQYMNIPVDELKATVDNALEKGYPVVWAADVSEGGFKWNKGVAVMPKERTQADMEGTELARWVKLSDKERAEKQFDFNAPVEEIEVTQESRQEMFDRQETTDDHGMELVGTAVDQKGNHYYKVKNSWDTNQVYDGFFYVSEPYFLSKTLSILVHRDAIPKNVAKKLK